MKKTILLSAAIAMVVSASAQKAKQDFAENPLKAGCTYYAYPGPQKQLTKAPKGKKPFYISHYGRHGSRWLIGRNDYRGVVRTLEKADSAGHLTAYGRELLGKIRIVNAASEKRLGELTLLGAQQHQDIARRMYERFPEVFKGNTNIEARSSVVIRCILSMENELMQLCRMNPKIHVWSDASEHDMWYMAAGHSNLGNKDGLKEAMKLYDEWYAENMKNDAMYTKIFGDTAYVNKNINRGEFNYRIYSIATDMQSTELRHNLSIMDVFTPEELYRCFQSENLWWFINNGSNVWTNGRMPYTQRYLLTDIIEKADSCIALEHPGATMRFGHDTMVCPMVSLLGINGKDKQIGGDLNTIDEQGWRMYEFVPMAANLQFVFYRKNASDDDVLVKVLLNEDEVPLTSDLSTDMYPYYHWKDVRDYFKKKIADFK